MPPTRRGSTQSDNAARSAGLAASARAGSSPSGADQSSDGLRRTSGRARRPTEVLGRDVPANSNILSAAAPAPTQASPGAASGGQKRSRCARALCACMAGPHLSAMRWLKLSEAMLPVVHRGDEGSSRESGQVSAKRTRGREQRSQPQPQPRPQQSQGQQPRRRPRGVQPALEEAADDGGIPERDEVVDEPAAAEPNEAQAAAPGAEQAAAPAAAPALATTVEQPPAAGCARALCACMAGPHLSAMLAEAF